MSPVYPGNPLSDLRDRFVAFAFSGADLLVELDQAAVIGFCAGGAQSLLGLTPEALRGMPFLDLVADDDREAALGVFDRLRRTRRIVGMLLRLRHPSGRTHLVELAGLSAPDMGGRLHLTLSRPRALPFTPGKPVEMVGPETFGLFIEKISDPAIELSGPVALTLLDADASAIRARLGEAGATALLRRMESRLRAWAAPGGPIGRLEDGRYGVVHEASILEGALRETLEAQAQEAGLPQLSYRVGAHRLELAGEVAPAERSDAVGFALWSFAKGVSGRFRLRNLGESLSALNAELRQRLRQLASAETPVGVPALYRPVLNLSELTVALADVTPLGAGAPTSANLRAGWDFALLRYALAMLEKQPSPFPFPLVSMRIAARTLGGRDSREPLLAALLQHPMGARRMVLEIEALDSGDEDAIGACARLKALGARLAVPHPGQADSLVSLLAAIEPAYVRAPAELIAAKPEPAARKRAAGSLARLCAQFGAQLSIDGVADRALLDDLKAGEVTLASGDALAKAAEDPSMVWGPGLRDRKNRPIAARPAPPAPRAA